MNTSDRPRMLKASETPLMIGPNSQCMSINKIPNRTDIEAGDPDKYISFFILVLV